MKKFLLLVLAFFAIVIAFFAQVSTAVAQSVDVVIQGQSLALYFATFASLVSLVAIITEFLKKLKYFENGVAKLVSWLVSIALSFIGWGLNLGLFEHMLHWYEVAATGFGVGLAANGFFDIELIKAVLKAIFKTGTEQKE